MRASEIFGAVDPHLKVIDGGVRRHSTKPTNNDDWEKSRGDICPRCHKEALRFRPSYGFCVECGEKLDEKDFRDRIKQKKFETYRRKHNARINGKKKRVR